MIAKVEEVNGELIPLTEVIQSFDELDVDSEQVKQESIPGEYKEELSQLLIVKDPILRRGWKMGWCNTYHTFGLSLQAA